MRLKTVSLKAAPVACLGLIVSACGDSNTGSPVASPGTAPSAETRVLDAGASLLQGKQPLQSLNLYLDGFHFSNGDIHAQTEAHHYCSVVNEEVFQCLLFDGNGRDAKIVGVEYIVSRRLFAGLDTEEKKLWHSHVYEVKSGQLIAPGVPEPAENELMEKIVDTYGKTWHTWQTDRGQALPLGHPMLMMGFTADGQAAPEMIAGRDRRFELTSEEKRAQRASIPTPSIVMGADAWMRGDVLQLALSPVTPPGAADQ